MTNVYSATTALLGAVAATELYRILIGLSNFLIEILSRIVLRVYQHSFKDFQKSPIFVHRLCKRFYEALFTVN